MEDKRIMSFEEERFDIYNERKERTGRTMARKGYFLREGEYCLIVLAIIARPDGRFLITRRAMDKRWAPGAWEVPGGGAMAGESSLAAVLRESREETGLELAGADIRLIDSYSNTDLARGDNYFVDIYHILADFDEADVSIQASEATDFAIVPFSRITELNREGAFLHYERIVTALGKMKEA